MKRRALLAAITLAALACGGKSEPKLTREAVLPGLQQEAQSLKADGEKMPALGMTTTWNVAAVDVQEQPGNEARPFRGTVRMRIETQHREPDGRMTESAIEKTFDYVYDAATKKWTFGR